jgi:hypothetical protein
VLHAVAAAVLLFALTVLLQMRAGAYGAAFDYDESSHVVSGLMIHDYLLHGLGRSPIGFLRQFHAHYPLVGIGHWGPLYYVVEAVWMLIFGTDRRSLLLLSAAVTVAAAMLVRHVVAHRGGAALGAAAATGLVVCTIFQEGSESVMLDGPIALLCLLAMLAYARFAERSAAGAGARPAVLFSVLAAAGLLIKGNAACLALLPPAFVLIGRRFDLLGRRAFWLPLPIVAVLAGPWTLLTYRLVAQGFRFHWGLDYSRVAVSANAGFLLGTLGPLVPALGLAGLVLVCRDAGRRADGGQDSVLVAAAALLVAVLLFLIVVPAAIQDRYLAPALPPLLILAAEALRRGVVAAAARFGGWQRSALALALAALAISAVPAVRGVAPKRRFGIVQAAPLIWQNRIAANPAVLIATDGAAESAAVAELAITDPARPSLFAVRGSRLLGGGGFNAADYQPRFATAAQAMAAIDDYAIPFVLLRLQSEGHAWQHLDQLEQARRAAPSRWQLVWQGESGGVPVALYRIRGNDTRPADPARLLALSAPHL